MLQTARCCRCVIFTLYVATVFPNLETSQLQTIVRDLDLITTLKQQLPVLITKCAHCDINFVTQICAWDVCIIPFCTKIDRHREIAATGADRFPAVRYSPHSVHIDTHGAYIRQMLCIAAHKVHIQCCRLCANINNMHSASCHKKSAYIDIWHIGQMICTAVDNIAIKLCVQHY